MLVLQLWGGFCKDRNDWLREGRRNSLLFLRSSAGLIVVPWFGICFHQYSSSESTQKPLFWGVNRHRATESSSWMPRGKYFAQQYLILACIWGQVHHLQDGVLTTEKELSSINNMRRDPLESTASASEANSLFLLLSLSPYLRTDETEYCLVTYSTALYCKWEEKVWKHYHLMAFYQKAFWKQLTSPFNSF